MDPLTAVKYCPDCKETKPLADFALNKRRPDGRGTYRRSCFNVRSREHRERLAAADGRKQVPPVEEFGSNRSAHDGRPAYCRPCHLAATRESAKRLYGSARDYHLRRRYGVTPADVDAMIETQGDVCAVCSGKPEHVDHDHETGQVRGILCFNCNQALGNARDNPQVLRDLARYLDVHRTPALRLVLDQGYWTGESPLEVNLRKHLAS